MGHMAKPCNAVGGRIRTKCPRCGKVLYIDVAPGTRQKVVRCGCGKSSFYKINYRQTIREAAFGRALVVFPDSMETKIRLCDTSSTGIGFLIASEYANALRQGQEIRIKSKLGSGSLAQRKVRVKNINGNRIGAQYV